MKILKRFFRNLTDNFEKLINPQFDWEWFLDRTSVKMEGETWMLLKSIEADGQIYELYMNEHDFSSMRIGHVKDDAIELITEAEFLQIRPYFSEYLDLSEADASQGNKTEGNHD